MVRRALGCLVPAICRARASTPAKPTPTHTHTPRPPHPALSGLINVLDVGAGAWGAYTAVLSLIVGAALLKEG